MTSTLFVVRENATSIERYHHVAAALQRYGHRSVFLPTDQAAEALLRGKIGSLDHQILPGLTLQGLTAPSWPLDGDLKPIRRSAVPLFRPRRGSLSFEHPAGMDVVMKATGFDLPRLLGEAIPAYRKSMAALAGRFDLLFGGLDTAVVVEDILYPIEHCALAWAAKRRSVPVVLLEHALGTNRQYAQLTQLADYYVAYSRENAEVLRESGLAADRVLFTGAPEPDPQTRFDGVWRKAWRQRQGLAPGRRVIAMPLQSLQHSARLRRMVLDLVSGAAATLTEQFAVILRGHPYDRGLWRADVEAHMSDASCAVLYDSGDGPVEAMLAASDMVVTFASSCVQQAVELDRPCAVIDIEAGIWPRWHEYQQVTTLSASGVGDFLRLLRDGGWPSGVTGASEARARFLERFSLNRGPDAADRIARAILGLPCHLLDRERAAAPLLCWPDTQG